MRLFAWEPFQDALYQVFDSKRLLFLTVIFLLYSNLKDHLSMSLFNFSEQKKLLTSFQYFIFKHSLSIKYLNYIKFNFTFF